MYISMRMKPEPASMKSGEYNIFTSMLILLAGVSRDKTFAR